MKVVGEFWVLFGKYAETAINTDTGTRFLQHGRGLDCKVRPAGLAAVLQREVTMALVSHPLVQTVIGCAIEVHRTLGPGLLESAYRPCLAREFRDKQIRYVTELTVPVVYKGEVVADCFYRLDFLIEGWLVLEIKSAERVIPAHRAQVITYVRLVGARQGLIFNFHVPRLKDGIVSVLAPEAIVDSGPGDNEPAGSANLLAGAGSPRPCSNRELPSRPQRD